MNREGKRKGSGNGKTGRGKEQERWGGEEGGEDEEETRRKRENELSRPFFRKGGRPLLLY